MTQGKINSEGACGDRISRPLPVIPEGVTEINVNVISAARNGGRPNVGDFNPTHIVAMTKQISLAANTIALNHELFNDEIAYVLSNAAAQHLVFGWWHEGQASTVVVGIMGYQLVLCSSAQLLCPIRGISVVNSDRFRILAQPELGAHPFSIVKGTKFTDLVLQREEI